MYLYLVPGRNIRESHQFYRWRNRGSEWGNDLPKVKSPRKAQKDPCGKFKARTTVLK